VPIHGQGYRRRGAAPPVARFRIAPIARLTFRQIVMRRVLIVLLAVSFAPMLLEAGGLFVLTRFPDLRAMVPPLTELFGRCLFLQALFAALLTVWAGTSLVADDFRTGALLVYFSRPLTRRDYVAGKLGVLVALNLSVTAAPLLLLWVLAVGLDSQDLVKRGLAFLPVAIAAQSVLISVTLALLALAAGAVTRSGTVGGALLVGGLVLFDAAAAVAPEGARLPLQILSVRRHLLSVEHALFGATPDPALLHWGAALLCLAVLVGGAGAVLWRRLQAVEVV
jgi:ABC-type transport system involved in multi-copper enzyme maturation permease subunit